MSNRQQPLSAEMSEMPDGGVGGGAILFFAGILVLWLLHALIIWAGHCFAPGIETIVITADWIVIAIGGWLANGAVYALNEESIRNAIDYDSKWQILWYKIGIYGAWCPYWMAFWNGLVPLSLILAAVCIVFGFFFFIVPVATVYLGYGVLCLFHYLKGLFV